MAVRNKSEETHCNLVYPLNRYHHEYSPCSMYIPSRTLLFKLMKACCGCEDIHDLWLMKMHPKFEGDFGKEDEKVVES